MNMQAWRYYSRFYERARLSLLLTLFLSIGQSLLNVPILLLIRYAFDNVLPSGELSLLAVIGVAAILLYLISGGATLYTRHLVLRISKLAIQRLRDEILQKFYTLPRAYYSEADRSRLHTVVVQDTERVDIMTNALVAQLAPSLIVAFVLSLVLIYLNWPLFLLLAAIFPILLVVSRSLGSLVSRRTYAFHRSFETFSKGMLFVLQMMDLTRLQSAEDVEMQRQRQYFEDVRLSSGQMAWLRTAYGVIQSTILATSVVIILIAGGAAIARGVLSLGGLVSFYAAVALLKPQLDTVLSCIPQVIEGNESLTTLYGLLGMEGSRPYSGTRRVEFSGAIRLESVFFQYKDFPVLRDVNFTIGESTTVALLGPNGSGKTTIANLILGFYRPQEGHLYADGLPFDDLDIIHLRSRIGVVPQNPIIFPGTILENITYGRPEADPQEISEACELALASEFIDKLPQGYSTVVGEHGVLLSGGQRQRIALARAFLRQPRLLILDEPTSHLDEQAVHQLVDHMRELKHGPASLIISHDMAMVRHADCAYLLNEGSIVASGHPAAIFDQEHIWGELISTKRAIHE